MNRAHLCHSRMAVREVLSIWKVLLFVMLTIDWTPRTQIMRIIWGHVFPMRSGGWPVLTLSCSASLSIALPIPRRRGCFELPCSPYLLSMQGLSLLFSHYYICFSLAPRVLIECIPVTKEKGFIGYLFPLPSFTAPCPVLLNLIKSPHSSLKYHNTYFFTALKIFPNHS